MKQPPPAPPGATPRAGAPRQAEARIRNLFQCEKKRPPLPLLFLAALLILSCGWLVSCRSQPAAPLVVMEVQHYDTNSNYLEIPTLVLPDGQKADEGLTSINRALSGLRDSYLPLLEGPLPSGTDGYDNCCLLYPAETDRYLNLLFFQTYFVSDLNTGHVLSLVYDKEERRQVSLEDALALAGVTEEGLYLALAEQYDPELAQEVPGADLCIQDPDLEGFRMGGDGPSSTSPPAPTTGRTARRTPSAGRSTSISGPLGPSPAMNSTTSACPRWFRRRSAWTWTRPCGGNGTSRTRSRRAASPPLPSPSPPACPAPRRSRRRRSRWCWTTSPQTASGRSQVGPGSWGRGSPPRPATW